MIKKVFYDDFPQYINIYKNYSMKNQENCTTSITYQQPLTKKLFSDL